MIIINFRFILKKEFGLPSSKDFLKFDSSIMLWQDWY